MVVRRGGMGLSIREMYVGCSFDWNGFPLMILLENNLVGFWGHMVLGFRNTEIWTGNEMMESNLQMVAPSADCVIILLCCKVSMLVSIYLTQSSR